MNNIFRTSLLGCAIIVISVIVVAGWVGLQFFTTYERNPQLPIHQLLEKQREALSPALTINKEKIWDDADFTKARWALYVNLNYNGIANLYTEEIHVFASPFRARLSPYPSPGSISIEKTYIPQEWAYHPKNADDLKITCNPEGNNSRVSQNCVVIVRYAEYIFVIIVPIINSISSYMTFDDLEKLLDTTDQFMGVYLKNSRLIPSEPIIPATK